MGEKMPGVTFLSWAGANGETIAYAIKAAAEAALRDVKIEIMSPRDRHGQEWPERLAQTLNNAAIGILVLTPECRSSWFLPWEIGMLSANPSIEAQDVPPRTLPSRDARLYAITFGLENVDILNKLNRNIWEFSRNAFLDLLKALREYHGTRALEWTIDPNDSNFEAIVWQPLKQVVDPLMRRLDIIERREQWISEMRETLLGKFDIHREDDFGDALSNLIHAGISHVGIFDQLINLLESLDPPSRRKRRTPVPTVEETRWLELETEMTERAIRRAADSVSTIRRGVVELPIEGGVEFYIREVLGRVHGSMWTTNISKYRGSFGRGSDAAVMRAHRQILELNPKASIQRVFVIDVSATPGKSFDTLMEDATELSDIMKQQELNGVETWAISEKVFYQIVQRNYQLVRRVGSADFNILDDCRVYVTKLSDHSDRDHAIEIDFIRLFRDRLVLSAALELKGIIMRDATRIYKGHLKEFFAQGQE